MCFVSILSNRYLPMASPNPVACAYNGLITCLAVISGFIFGLMAFFIGADVFMRNVMGSGMPWVIEATEYAMYVATVFAAPWVLREGSHVSVDVLTSMLPQRCTRYVVLLASLLGSVICLIVFYYSAIATINAFERSSMVYKSFTIPEWWVNIFVPFGMALMTIEFLLLFWSRVVLPSTARSGNQV